jgi:hypothetical protein
VQYNPSRIYKPATPAPGERRSARSKAGRRRQLVDLQSGPAGRRVLAGPIETQNIPTGLGVERRELFSHAIQVSCRDAMISRSGKQQRHRGFPPKLEGFGEYQCRLTVVIR